MHLNVASRRRKPYLEFVWARAPRFFLWLLLLNDQKGVCVGDCVDLVPASVHTPSPDVDLKDRICTINVFIAIINEAAYWFQNVHLSVVCICRLWKHRHVM